MPKWMVQRTYRFIVEGKDLPASEQHLSFYAAPPQVAKDEQLPRITKLINVSTSFHLINENEEEDLKPGQYHDTAGAIRSDGHEGA